ncbi:L-lactate dehydrogenase [Linum perenne]
MLDRQHVAAFLPRTKILSSTDFSGTARSDLCIVTAGARQNPGESRLKLLQRNIGIFKSIIPSLAKHSVNAILLIVSNLRRVEALRVPLEPGHQIGFLIADHLDVNAQI